MESPEKTGRFTPKRIGHGFNDARTVILVIDNLRQCVTFYQRLNVGNRCSRNQQVVVKNARLDAAGVDANVENVLSNVEPIVAQVFRYAARLFEYVSSGSENESCVWRPSYPTDKSHQLRISVGQSLLIESHPAKKIIK